MSAFIPPAVLGLGELLWDDFPDGKRTGGAPANVAFQVNQLGCRGLIASRVGNDADGAELLQVLAAQGLDLSCVQKDSEHSTGRVTVELSHGIPSYQIHENSAWDFLELDETFTEAAQQASAICFGTLAQRNPPSRETIQKMVALTSPECLRVYDVNLRQRFYQSGWVQHSLKLANIVKLNDEEVRTLGPLLGLPVDEVEFSRNICHLFGPQIVCVTRGAQGCLIVTKFEEHDIPGRPVKVADTVGAGDAFTAALIVAQLKKWPLPLSGEFANRVGGIVASRQGAMPDLRREFEQLLEQYAP